MEEKALKKVSTEMLEVSMLDLNDGQVEGLPKNPRQWREENLEKLRKSLDNDPEFMNYNPVIVYPYNGRFVVIGGNMRISVCQEKGVKKVPCMVLPKDTPAKKLQAYTIKDNTTFGDWDWLELENWNAEELNEWGLDGFGGSAVDMDSFFESNSAEPKQKEEVIKVFIAVGMEEQRDAIKTAVQDALSGYIGVRVE